jgi:filamentous hemagglutinin
VAKINDPSQVYYSLKTNIDAAASFTEYGLGEMSPLTAEKITSRVVNVAIPQTTTPAQWVQINKAID